MSITEKNLQETIDQTLCCVSDPMTTAQKRNAMDTATAIENLVVSKGLSQVEAGSLLLLMASEFLENVPRTRLHEILDECLGAGQIS